MNLWGKAFIVDPEPEVYRSIWHLWQYFYSIPKSEKTHPNSSWRKNALQMWLLWLDIFSIHQLKGDIKSVHESLNCVKINFSGKSFIVDSEPEVNKSMWHFWQDFYSIPTSENTHQNSSWRNKALQMWLFWLDIFSIHQLKGTHQKCPWRTKCVPKWILWQIIYCGHRTRSK